MRRISNENNNNKTMFVDIICASLRPFVSQVKHLNASFSFSRQRLQMKRAKCKKCFALNQNVNALTSIEFQSMK